MTRKRCSSYVESSDDEFQLSDRDASPTFSRLKRPRRAHNKDTSAATASQERTNFRPDDNDNSSVVIPDSLDEHDNKSIPESVAMSLPDTPKDPVDDDTRETERPSENGDDVDHESDAEDNDDVVEIINEASRDKNVDESTTNVPKVKTENASTSGRRRQSRKVYQIDSDSEEASDDGNDDDDAYNSAEDSPPEDEADSEFDFSPRKPTKKKEKTPAKRTPLRQTPPTPTVRKLATRKLATRKLATKSGPVASKASTGVRSASKLPPTSGGAKRLLGARLPHRGLLTGKSPATDKKRPQTLGKLPSAPVIRSGLSRKAAVPRLHAYLPR